MNPTNACLAIALVVTASACSVSSSPASSSSPLDATPSPREGSDDAGKSIAQVPDSGSPATPSNAACVTVDDLRATSSTSTAIDLAWAAIPNAKLTIERKSYCGSDTYQLLATPSAGASTYADTSVQADWVYWYRVAVVDGSGAVISSSTVTAQAASAPSISCGGTTAPQTSDAVACSTSTPIDTGANAPLDAGTSSPIDASTPDASEPDSPDTNTPTSAAQPAGYWAGWGTWTVGAGSATAPAHSGGNTINVCTGDDIQSKVNASQAGDRIQFCAGKYSVASELSFPPDRYYDGAGAEFDWTGAASSGLSDTYFFQVSGTSTVITGFNFNGAGLAISDHTTVQIVGNSFEPGNNRGIFIGSNLTDSHLSHNTFTNCSNDCMYGYSPVRSDFSYNEIVGNRNDPMHFTWFGDFSSNHTDVTITHNSIHHTYHYCLEMQGTPYGLEVAYNYCGDGLAYHDGFSIATGTDPSTGVNSTNVTIHDNVLVENPSGGIAIEAMGNNTAIFDNLFAGHWYSSYVSTAAGTDVMWGENTSACSFVSNTITDSAATTATWNTMEYEGTSCAAANVYGNALLSTGSLPTPSTPKVL